MLELFVEYLYDGKPRIERVMHCYVDGVVANLRLESMCNVPGSKPSRPRDHEACKWTWDAMLAVEYAHYDNPRIAKDAVRWFCRDGRVS